VAGTLSSPNNRVRFLRKLDLPQGTDRRRLKRSLRPLTKERDELSSEIPRPAFVQARRGIIAGESAFTVDQPGPTTVRVLS
jgi:hypothetical protein